MCPMMPWMPGANSGGCWQCLPSSESTVQDRHNESPDRSPLPHFGHTFACTSAPGRATRPAACPEHRMLLLLLLGSTTALSTEGNALRRIHPGISLEDGTACSVSSARCSPVTMASSKHGSSPRRASWDDVRGSRAHCRRAPLPLSGAATVVARTMSS